MVNRTTKIGLVFDVIIILIILSVVLRGTLGENSPFLGAVFPFTIGLLMLTSEKLKDISYFSRALGWTAENIFKPKTRFNYLIWGGFFIIMSGVTVFYNSRDVSNPELFDQIESSYGYWLGIILVLAFNIGVGVYTAKIARKRKHSK